MIRTWVRWVLTNITLLQAFFCFLFGCNLVSYTCWNYRGENMEVIELVGTSIFNGDYLFGTDLSY